MNQACRVCGEPAAGYHFGAFTCEGCKSFFGRTYNNLGSMPECKNKGECEINKRNRTACKCCRYRKCLKVGMSKESSRYGRRSNWFKTHCATISNSDMLAMEMRDNSSPFGLNFGPSQSSSMKDRNVVANEMPGTSSSSVLNFNPLQAQLYNWCFRSNAAAVQSQLPIVSLPCISKEVESLSFDNLQRQQSPATATPTTFLQTDMRVPFYSVPSTEFGPSNPDTDEDYSDCSNSRWNNTPSSSASSMTNEQERFKPEVSINGTVMLATNDRPQLNYNSFYSPVVTTMAAHPARCRDQLPVSPNPGVIADEQNQPIDLSIRASGRSSQIKAQNKNEECEADENPLRPLDLTLAAFVP